MNGSSGNTINIACNNSADHPYLQFILHPSWDSFWNIVLLALVVGIPTIIKWLFDVFMKKTAQDVMGTPIGASSDYIKRKLVEIFGMNKQEELKIFKPMSWVSAVVNSYIAIIICIIMIPDDKAAGSSLALSALIVPLTAIIVKISQKKFYLKIYNHRSFVNDFLYADLCMLASGITIMFTSVVGMILLFPVSHVRGWFWTALLYLSHLCSAAWHHVF